AAGNHEGVIFVCRDRIDGAIDSNGIAPVVLLPAPDLAGPERDDVHFGASLFQSLLRDEQLRLLEPVSREHRHTFPFELGHGTTSLRSCHKNARCAEVVSAKSAEDSRRSSEGARRAERCGEEEGPEQEYDNRAANGAGCPDHIGPRAARAAQFKCKLARAERKYGKRRDRDGGAERHGESCRHARPVQSLRHREDEHEDRSGTRPDPDRKDDCNHLSPRNGARELARIDDMIAGLAWRMVMAMAMMAVMAVIVVVVMRMVLPMIVGVMAIIGVSVPRLGRSPPCAP